MILARVDLASCLDEACAVFDVDVPALPLLLPALLLPFPAPDPLLKRQIIVNNKFYYARKLPKTYFFDDESCLLKSKRSAITE
jgi:hypothetical protein